MISKEELKLHFTYLLATSTGALATLTVLGLVGAIVYEDRVLFLIPLTGYLVSRARLEQPNVVVLQEREK